MTATTLFDLFSSVNSGSYGFPFYNFKKTDFGYVLEMALAGYSLSDVTVDFDEGKLTIASPGVSNETENFIFQGFSFKKFQRNFRVSPDLNVKSAALKDGILSVEFELVQKPKKNTSVKIKTANDLETDL